MGWVAGRVIPSSFTSVLFPKDFYEVLVFFKADFVQMPNDDIYVGLLNGYFTFMGFIYCRYKVQIVVTNGITEQIGFTAFIKMSVARKNIMYCTYTGAKDK